MDHHDSPDPPTPVKLVGATNLRDLGGWPTATGHRVRRGLIYRSDSLAALTDADHTQIAALNIRVTCDLRGERESIRAPSILHGAIRHAFPIESRFEQVARLGADGQRPAFDASQMTQYMRDVYRNLPDKATPHLRQLFALILQNHNLPLLFHCTAGKDRTGFVAAVILKALQVPQSSIERDYLATNESWIPAFSLPGHVSPEATRILCSAETEWLTLAFDVIDQHHGSFDDYLHTVLQLDESSRHALLERLTEPAVSQTSFTPR